MLTNLLQKEGEALNIYAKRNVIENDGFELTDDCFLQIPNGDLMLLEEEEIRTPKNSAANGDGIKSDDNPRHDWHDVPLANTSNSETLQDDSEKDSDTEAADPPKLQSHDVYKLKTFKYWGTWSIPWHAMEPEIYSRLNAGLADVTDGQRKLKLKKAAKVAVVKRVVSEMRALSDKIHNADFRVVAKKMMEDFPIFFEDQTDKGKRFGSGYISMTNALINRNCNLNRSSSGLDKTLKIATVQKFEVRCFKLGCPNWQPTSHPDGETSESIEDKKKMLHQLKCFPVDDSQEILIAMQNAFVITFAAQSFDIEFRSK